MCFDSKHTIKTNLKVNWVFTLLLYYRKSVKTSGLET